MLLEHLQAIIIPVLAQSRNVKLVAFFQQFVPLAEQKLASNLLCHSTRVTNPIWVHHKKILQPSQGGIPSTFLFLENIIFACGFFWLVKK